MLARPDGTVLAEVRRPTPSRRDDLIEAIISVTRHLWAHSGRFEPQRSVGVGVPGMVDRKGVLRYAPNLHAADGMAVAATVADVLGLAPTQVYIDNDNTCATWAELCLGAGRGVDDLLFVALGTGIGGGMVANGNLVRGHHGFAGELGHFCVEPDGLACPCGQRGCWERYASGSGLAYLTRLAALEGKLPGLLAAVGGDVNVLVGEHVTAAFERGDPEVGPVLDRFARWVAIGVAGLVAILDPGVVVLGGGLSRSHSAWLPRTVKSFDELTEGRRYRSTILLPAVMGEQAAAVGAALMAAQVQPSSP